MEIFDAFHLARLQFAFTVVVLPILLVYNAIQYRVFHCQYVRHTHQAESSS